MLFGRLCRVCKILRNETLMPSATVDMDTMPLRRGHLRVWFAASLGQVAGAGIATLAGIVLPMLQLYLHPALSSFEQGAVACTSLVGIMAGSMLFGAWSDRTGYLLFFRLCPVLVMAAALLAWRVDTPAGLVAGLFLMGLGIGGDYTLDSDYISEIMPRRWRLTLVGAAKAASATGSILFAAVAWWLLRRWDDPHLCNRLWLLVAGLALVMLLCRIRFGQSPGWLIARGRTAEAEQAVRRFLGPDVRIGEIAARPRREASLQKNAWRELFRRGNRTKIVFSGLPWACEGVGVYGIGVFLPVLVMALGLDRGAEAGYDRIVRSVELTTWINLCILPGFALGLWLVNRWCHVRTQTWGFVLAAAGLGLLLAAYGLHAPRWLCVAGFMLFELFLNAGPHLMTFILPPQIYPVAERGAGTGLAAACGKAGAVAGVLFLPLLLERGGVAAVLAATLALQLAGALTTALLGRKILPCQDPGHRPELRHDR